MTDHPSRLTVGPQVRADDIPALKAQGIRGIVCNRPDGEEPGQPAFAEIAAAAEAAGLQARWLPFGAEGPAPGLAERFARAVADMQGPVLAYCRTGNRSALLARAAGLFD